jgi:hypothetical protein
VTKYEHAAQIWPILALAARNRQGITAELLAKLIGLRVRDLPELLGPIQSYCSINDLPLLTVIVIPPNSSVPGDGVVLSQHVPLPHAAVYGFGWLGYSPPTAAMLEQAFRQQPIVGAQPQPAGKPRGGWLMTIKDPHVLCDQSGGLVMALCCAADGDSGSAPMLVSGELANEVLQELRQGSADAVRYQARRLDAQIAVELKKYKFIWARVTMEGGWKKSPTEPMGSG